MNESILNTVRDKMKKAVGHTRDEMLHIRTGKAVPALLDVVKVDYYGTHLPLKQIANISAPEARLLMVQPYDRNALGAVEKAILASDLGLTPQNDGLCIRLPIPMLTTERREELIKVVRKMAEEGRVAIRNIRRDAKEAIKKAEKAGELSEDESRRILDMVQKETDAEIAAIDALLKTREVEIREE